MSFSKRRKRFPGMPKNRFLLALVLLVTLGGAYVLGYAVNETVQKYLPLVIAFPEAVIILFIILMVAFGPVALKIFRVSR